MHYPRACYIYVDTALVIAVLTFIAVVALAAAVFVWVARAQGRYMNLRAEGLSEIPPLADSSIRDDLLRRPWLWPVRVGSLWRAQTAYDNTVHLEPDLEMARLNFERRQRVALVVYVLGIAAILLSTLVRV